MAKTEPGSEPATTSNFDTNDTVASSTGITAVTTDSKLWDPSLELQEEVFNVVKLYSNGVIIGRNDVFVKINDIQLLLKDFLTILRIGDVNPWLNDNVLNGYLKLVAWQQVFTHICLMNIILIIRELDSLIL